MTTTIAALMDRIHALQDEVEREFAERRAAFRYSIVNKRIVFEDQIAERHRQLRESVARYIAEAKLLHILTAPVIYALIVPFAFMDACASIYQAVCFPAWGIAKVKRGDYLIFDRVHLGYLNAIEKLNCAYCSYANGVIGYVREIAARTEQFWCPIKHAQRRLAAHDRYTGFSDFGDAEGYRSELPKLRDDLKRLQADGDPTG